MVLVDTSVWIHHFRIGEPALQKLLGEEEVLTHPFIIGEIACGNITNRQEILSLLRALPGAKIGEEKEVLLFIEKHQLYGKGLGYIDAHLMVSSLLSKSLFWTFDNKLKKASKQFGIFFVY
jgi:predicted nucleic acid-binding protein